MNDAHITSILNYCIEILDTMLLRGDLAHCTDLGKLEILKDHLIGEYKPVPVNRVCSRFLTA